MSEALPGALKAVQNIGVPRLTIEVDAPVEGYSAYRIMDSRAKGIPLFRDLAPADKAVEIAWAKLDEIAILMAL